MKESLIKTRLINFTVGCRWWSDKYYKLTACPFNKKTKLLNFPISVGSMACKNCEYFSGILPIEQVVECKCEGGE